MITSTEMAKDIGRDDPSADRSLSSKLRGVRSQFLHDVESGGSKQWVVVMGNESGDLDTVASSLAYWWFRREVLSNDKVIPLLQTPRAEMKLRPENEYALSLASLDPAHEDLLCINDIPSAKTFPADKFVLVDHNRLLSRFSDNNPGASVVAIMDHHEDERLHLEANPRIVKTPVGSASSLVTQYIKDNLPSDVAIPPEVSSLLFSAIMVDTGGLKPGGKAEDVDRASAAFIFPGSVFAQSGNLAPHEAKVLNVAQPETLHENPVVHSIFDDLITRKNDVSHLDASDLLKRDYKQYQWDPRQRSPSFAGQQTRKVNVGLSTVPLGLHAWLPRSGATSFFETVLEYMSTHDLDILGILTSFHDDRPAKHHGKGDNHEGKGNGKHKRQIMLIFRSPQDQTIRSPALVQHVFSSLMIMDSAKVLELEEVKALKHFDEDDSPANWSPGTSKGGVLALNDLRLDVLLFKQKNAKATRKIVAPLLKEIIEGGGES